MKRLLSSCLATGCVAWLTAAAGADVAPGGWVDSRLVGSQLEMRDTQTGRIILARQGLPLLGWFPVGIVSTTEVTPAVDGADVRFTFRNTSGESKRLGRILVGIMNLGADIEYFDFRQSCLPTAANSGSFVGQARMYPDDLYSPVAVLRNENMAIGLSLQYPVMEYKHDIRVGMGSPPSSLAVGEAGRGWMVDFGLANVNQEGPDSTMVYEASLAPSEERTYTLSIRVTKTPDVWQQTLLPYRDYFRETYGPVKYERQTNPVMAMQFADPSLPTTGNPYGYTSSLRPDALGIQPIVDKIRRESDWPMVMVWAPTGVYMNHRDRNWPFQFASHFNSSPRMREAFSPQGLPSIAANGQTLGLWWGRSCEVARSWDTAAWEPFDPDNAEHRTAVLAEMDAAQATGATWVGLDTFAHHITPIWKLRPWYRSLRERYPTMHFVSEPSMCDVMHVELPTFISAWTNLDRRPLNTDGLFAISGPNALADLLIPGHETWAGYRYNDYRRFFGTPSDARIRADMQRFADWGYRPCFFADAANPGAIHAAPSWETSIPASIRSGDQWMTDIREGRNPGQSADQPPSNDGGSGGGSSNPGGGSADAGGGGGGNDVGGSDEPPQVQGGSGDGPRRSIIRVRPGGPTPSAGPTRRMSGNWRNLIRRPSTTYQVQREKGAGERLRDEREANGGD